MLSLIIRASRSSRAVDDYLKATGKVPGEFLFTSRRRVGEAMTTRQYARLVAEWVAGIGLDPHIFSTHSLRKWKVRSVTSGSRLMMRLPSLSKLKSEVSGQSGHCSARLLAALRANWRPEQVQQCA